jgi:hypothetical protein
MMPRRVVATAIRCVMTGLGRARHAAVVPATVASAGMPAGAELTLVICGRPGPAPFVNRS